MKLSSNDIQLLSDMSDIIKLKKEGEDRIVNRDQIAEANNHLADEWCGDHIRIHF